MLLLAVLEATGVGPCSIVVVDGDPGAAVAVATARDDGASPWCFMSRRRDIGLSSCMLLLLLLVVEFCADTEYSRSAPSCLEK